MKIMIIGGYGQVGSLVVRELMRKNTTDTIVIAGRHMEQAKKIKAEWNTPSIEC